jgi:dTDP-L-rhamnose 4-epimerase
MSKKILVTGSEGFIGSVVVRKLRDAGHQVSSTDSYETQVHGRPFRWGRAGDCNWFIGFDAIIHLAAKVGVGQSMYDPVDYVDCNSLDTVKFLHNLREHKPKRLVVASSMSIYGEGSYVSVDGRVIHQARRTPDQLARHQWEPGEGCYRSIPTPECKPPDLTSIYALTKYDQEQLCLIWGSAYNVPTVALRFFNVFGQGQALQNPYTGALAIFATRILNGKAPTIYEDGQQTRDFIHVEDVANAVVHAATSDIPGGTYNVGTGTPRTIESVAITLAEKLGADLPPLITGQYRAGDIRHCYADATKLKETGWEPKISFEDGIAGYCDWLREQPLPEDRFDRAAKELEAAGLVK